MARVLISLILFASYLASITGLDLFNPITETKPFRAIFRIQKFIDGVPDKQTDVYEHYQPALESAQIWLKTYGFNDGKGAKVRQFVYTGATQQILEVFGGSSEIPNEIFLYEDGSSSSYEATDIASNKRVATDKRNITLDSIVFKRRDKNDPKLDLDLYLSDLCKEKTQGKLHYIQGISRLFHLIECRRKDFRILKSRSDDLTRGIHTRVYKATKLPAFTGKSSQVGKVIAMDVSVSLPGDQLAKNPTTRETELPSQMLPLSVTIEYSPSVMILINLLQFDVLSFGDHLSESGDSFSTFLLPLNQNYDEILNDNTERENELTGGMEFMLKAQLTGSHMPYEDPVEILVAYNGYNEMLTRKTTYVDRSISLGDSWSSLTNQVVYDGRSMLKYHIMPSNEDHIEAHEEVESAASSRTWRSCVTNNLTPFEKQTIESGAGEIFNLNGAFYIGMAIVRGIDCHVYQRRIFHLPLWLGLGGAEHLMRDQLADSEIYATVYEVASGISRTTASSEQQMRADDDKRSRFVRLTISFKSSSPKETDSSSFNYNLEIHYFNWSSNSVHDVPELLDVGQECLVSQVDSRHLDMSLLLDPQQPDGSPALKLSGLLLDDDGARDEVASEMLFDVFKIAPTQQVDLRTNVNKLNHFEVSLKVFEPKIERHSVRKVGFARDKSIGDARNGWSVGVTSVSLEECLWRLAHTLRPGSSSDEQRDKERLGQMLMYCPDTYHCVLGDKKWLPMLRDERVEIDSLLKFPVGDKVREKCVVYFLTSTLQKSPTHLNSRDNESLLGWLSGRRDRFLGTSLELRVDRANNSTFAMRVAKLKLGNPNDARQLAPGLSKPLHGVGYASNDQTEPLVVDNLAQCSHYCLINHRCASYSTCHRADSKLECILAALNWTKPAKISELRAKLNGPFVGDKSSLFTINVSIGDSSQVVQVAMKRSSLCTLHSRSHIDVFQYKNSGLGRILNVKHLLGVESREECARFCLGRAHFISETNTATDLRRQFQSVCTNFRFSSELGVCQLMPPYDVGEKLGRNPSSHDPSLLGSWSEAFNLIQTRQKELTSFIDGDHYVIDLSQIYFSYPNMRLVAADESGSSLQETFANVDEQNCARLCLSMGACRSFDFMDDANKRADCDRASIWRQIAAVATKCTLNMASVLPASPSGDYDYLARASGSQWKVEKCEQCWHYEPTELALYASGARQIDYKRKAEERCQSGVDKSAGEGQLASQRQRERAQIFINTGICNDELASAATKQPQSNFTTQSTRSPGQLNDRDLEIVPFNASGTAYGLLSLIATVTAIALAVVVLVYIRFGASDWRQFLARLSPTNTGRNSSADFPDNLLDATRNVVSQVNQFIGLGEIRSAQAAPMEQPGPSESQRAS